MSFEADPNKVIPPTIAGALNALKSAYAEPSVKRFVLTSSSTAAIIPTRDQGRVVITHDSWNERAVKEAWADPPYDGARSLWTYGASKTQAEQEVWKYHKENRHKRPDLVVNAGKKPSSSQATWHKDLSGAHDIQHSVTKPGVRSTDRCEESGLPEQRGHGIDPLQGRGPASAHGTCTP